MTARPGAPPPRRPTPPVPPRPPSRPSRPPTGGSQSGSTSDVGQPGPGTRIGDFVIEREIGRGGMGAVFRVVHATTRAPYALKLVLPGKLSSEGSQGLVRFQREIDALTRLDGHPGIVRLFQAGRFGAAPYYVMELVEGATLKERLAAEGRLPPERGVALVVALARAVDHAHRRNVLHRDLKPANILIDEHTGAARILDFGLARTATDSSLTKTGEVLGTPGYMAPEQVGSEDGRVTMGPETDVYGLGAILYHVLTGQRPFHGLGQFRAIAAVVTEHPTAPRDIDPSLSPELEAIILRAMEKEPAARYARAADLVADLEAWAAGESVSARPLGRVSRIARRFVPARGPRRTAAVAMVATVAASIAVGVAAGIFALVADTGAQTASEAARRHEELAAGIARIDAGEIAAITATRAVAEAILAAEEGDPDARLALALLDDLDALLDPGRAEVAAHEIDLTASPWSTRRGTVIAILAEAGATRALGKIIARFPAALDARDEGRATSVAAELGLAVADGRLEPSDALARAIDRSLARDETPEAAALRVAVAAARVDHLVGASESSGSTGDETEVAAWLDRLVDAAEHTDQAPLARPLRERIHALAMRPFADAERRGELEPIDPVSLRAIRAALVFPPAESERLDLILGLQKRFYEGKHEVGVVAVGRAFDLAMILFERGEAMPFPRDLDIVMEAGLDVDRRLADQLTRDVADRDAFVMAVLIDLAARRADLDAQGGSALRPSGIRDVWLRHWRSFEAILEREEARGDVPAWALARLALDLRALERVIARGGGTSRAAKITETAKRVTGATDLLALVDHLFGLALDARFERSPPWHRSEVLRFFLERHHARTVEPIDDATIERLAIACDDLAFLFTDLDARSIGWALRDPEIQAQLSWLLREAYLGLTHPGRRHQETDCRPCDQAERLARAGEQLLGAESWMPAGLRAIRRAAHGEPAAALADLEEAYGTVKLQGGPPHFEAPLEVHVLCHRAELLIVLGRTGEAKKQLEETFRAPVDPPLLARRAAAWDALGEADRAAADRATLAGIAKRRG